MSKLVGQASVDTVFDAMMASPAASVGYVLSDDDLDCGSQRSTSVFGCTEVFAEDFYGVVTADVASQTIAAPVIELHGTTTCDAGTQTASFPVSEIKSIVAPVFEDAECSGLAVDSASGEASLVTTESAPAARADGAAALHPRAEGAAAPHPRAEGAALPHPRAEGTAVPYPRGDGAAAPHPRAEGAAVLHPRADGAAAPQSRAEGAALPHPRAEGAAVPYPRGAECEEAPDEEADAGPEVRGRQVPEEVVQEAAAIVIDCEAPEAEEAPAEEADAGAGPPVPAGIVDDKASDEAEALDQQRREPEALDQQRREAEALPRVRIEEQEVEETVHAPAAVAQECGRQRAWADAGSDADDRGGPWADAAPGESGVEGEPPQSGSGSAAASPSRKTARKQRRRAVGAAADLANAVAINAIIEKTLAEVEAAADQGQRDLAAAKANLALAPLGYGKVLSFPAFRTPRRQTKSA
jgi:hypothetical protein